MSYVPGENIEEDPKTDQREILFVKTGSVLINPIVNFFLTVLP